MLTLKSSTHIPTRQMIKNFRSGYSSTGLSLRHVEARRMDRERIRLENRRQRRAWLERQWSAHVERKATQIEDRNP